MMTQQCTIAHILQGWIEKNAFDKIDDVFGPL
jgi:hypothetical protein